MKTAALILLSVGTVWLGFEKAKKLSDKALFLDTWSRFLSFCYDQIRFCGTDTRTLLKAGANRFPTLTFLSSSNRDKQNLFGYETEVSSFFSSLGTTDLIGQKQLLERTVSYFECEKMKAKEECERMSKPYRMLGLLGSAAVIILFI